MKHAALALLVVLVACASASKTTSRHEARRLRFRGSILVGQDGRLVMAFEEDACVVRGSSHSCGAFPFNGLPDTFLVTPWGAEVPATSGGDQWLGFEVDWKGSELDPLREAHVALLARAWHLESTRNVGGPARWSPKAEDLDTMRQVLARATGIEIDVRAGEPPPHLEVHSLQPRGVLRNGARTTLTLELGNTGRGTASLVVARTLSNVPALHGLQFSFGQLAPGTRETRSLVVDLPRDNREPEVVLVVELIEAGGFVPPPRSLRLPVREAATQVQLSLKCQVQGTTEAVPAVDAGRLVVLECVLGNQGAPARGVVVTARLAGGHVLARSDRLDLGAEVEDVLALSVEVPRKLQIDDRVIFELEARDEARSAVATARVETMISRGRLCPAGRIDRKTYLGRLADVRKTHADGLVSKEQLRTYEDELVGCLEVASPLPLALDMRLACQLRPSLRPIRPGQRILIDCRVSNLGAPARAVRVKARARGKTLRSEERAKLSGQGEWKVVVPAEVPADAVPGQIVHVKLELADADGPVRADAAEVRVVVVCGTEPITREQFLARMTTLGEAHTAGRLSQRQLSVYVAQLLSCMDDDEAFPPP